MENRTISRHHVAYMFNRIALRYDRINRILSFGLDLSWRKKISTFLPIGHHLTLVDLATGTGDQIFCLAKNLKIDRFIGFDISEKMLKVGLEKVKKERLESKISLQLGSALDIPLGDSSCDVATLSFGIRNVTNPLLAIKELYRVLKPGGRVIILEFSLPKNPLVRAFYLPYLRHILPPLGLFLSKDKEAYSYLHQSIEEFCKTCPIHTLLQEAGFQKIEVKPLTFGVVSLFIGEK
jgi:demethylmenaquinone methyltransferase/2-methoxy-6-polyprenyl-1,4-benzoquinol methylase